VSGGDNDRSDALERILNSGADESGVDNSDDSTTVQASNILERSKFYINSLVVFTPSKQQWLLTKN
jgi:hypothetical protein